MLPKASPGLIWATSRKNCPYASTARLGGLALCTGVFLHGSCQVRVRVSDPSRPGAVLCDPGAQPAWVWSAEADGPDLGEVRQFIDLAAGAGASAIYALCSDAGMDLSMMRWKGSGMTGVTEMENALGSTAATQQFALVVPTWPALRPPRLGQWQQTDPN